MASVSENLAVAVSAMHAVIGELVNPNVAGLFAHKWVIRDGVPGFVITSLVSGSQGDVEVIVRTKFGAKSK